MKPAGVARRVWATLWFAGLVAAQPAGLRAEAADAETVAETVSAAATAAPAGTPCPRLAAVRVRSASAGDAALAREGAACNVAADSPPLAANEYTAYVVMFATMAPDLRRRILADFPGQGLANTLQIHPFVYLADPLQFGVDAWRHDLRRPDGAAWLRDLVAGRIVQDLPTEGP